MGVNWVLTSVTAIIALSLKPAGLLQALPFAIQVLITVLVLDFMYGYVSHVLLHKIPRMWQVHRVHHSDPFVDVTTLLRQHPVETLWRFLFMTIPAWALGLPAAGIVVYRLVSRVNGVLEHANIRLWRPLDRAGSLIWCTRTCTKCIIPTNRRKPTPITETSFQFMIECSELSQIPIAPGTLCTG